MVEIKLDPKTAIILLFLINIILAFLFTRNVLWLVINLAVLIGIYMYLRRTETHGESD